MERDYGVVHVELRIRSSALEPTDITEVLGVSATRTLEKGAPIAVVEGRGVGVVRRASWIRDSIYFVDKDTEGLSAAVLDVTAEVDAAKVSELKTRDPGCDIELLIDIWNATDTAAPPRVVSAQALGRAASLIDYLCISTYHGIPDRVAAAVGSRAPN